MQISTVCLCMQSGGLGCIEQKQLFSLFQDFLSFLALLLHLQNVYFSGLKTIDILYIKIQTLKRRIM